jgi:DNA-binding IclR family transcriptional regulator
MQTVDRELGARMLAEFQEMPGLCLTLAQAARFWNVDSAQCLALLQQLVASGALRRTSDGRYVSASASP